MEEQSDGSGRRGFIRRIVSLGGVGAVLGLLQKVNIPKASAADGDVIKIGCETDGSNPGGNSGEGTKLYTHVRGAPAFEVENEVDKNYASNNIAISGAVLGPIPGSIAVQGRSYGESGMGVYGTANYGACFGVYGATGSPQGTGVSGRASSTSGQNCGVYGSSDSREGAGVYAYNSARSGQALKIHGHAYPDKDNAYNCGDTTKRWSLVAAKTVKQGDLVYENGVRTTEEGSGIAFYNPRGVKIAILDSEGNWHIKGKIVQDL